jgi:hypothetical protein
MENQEVNMNEQSNVHPQVLARQEALTKGTPKSKEYKAKLEYEVEILELEARHTSAQYNSMRGALELNKLREELAAMQAQAEGMKQAPPKN